MANGATMRSRTATNDTVEMESDADVIDMSNHSYGFVHGWDIQDLGLGFGLRDVWLPNRSDVPGEDPGFGKYNGYSQSLDAVLFNNPHLLSVWSGGNQRDDQFTNFGGDGQYVAFFSQNPGGVAWHGPDWYLVAAAGNPNTVAPPGDGNAGTGFDSLSPDKLAKNTVVVGAVNDVVADPYTSAQIQMTGFSSWGPTDDGRIKPDLVANGQEVFSYVEHG
jgi:hypothetical protein